MSLRLLAFDLLLRVTSKPYLAREQDALRARTRMDRLMQSFPLPAGAAPRPITVAGLPALRVDAPQGRGVLLWLHGGAYVIGSPRSHVAMAAALAFRAGMAAVLPDYRLAPEHPFPAAPEDALAVYRALLGAGEPAAGIAIGGDSAGGGLAFALLHMILAEGLPRPGALVAFSPWTDLTLSGASLRSRARRDAMLPARRLPDIRDKYLAGSDPADPRASPVFGTYAGAPPVLVLASHAEILLDDARTIAARLEDDGATVTLDLWRAVPHAWPLLQGRLPEADRALDRAAAFLREAMGMLPQGQLRESR